MSFYNELIEWSQAEKRGLTIFIKGQTVAGVVVKIIDGEAIEVRSQTYSRVVIRLDSIDAMAAA
jgi:endonuclease YncB( thermonuclease family)